MLWIETMSSEEELRAAVEGAAQAGLPIVTTMSFDTNGRTMMGITPQAFGALAASLSAQPVAIGANCGVGASELVATVLGITAARPDAHVVAKGNCGIPQYVDGHIHYTGTPELMADYARIALDAGARIIGGCCGTSPEHLAAMRHRSRPTARASGPTVDDDRGAARLRLGTRQGLRCRGRRCGAPRAPPRPRLACGASTAICLTPDRRFFGPALCVASQIIACGLPKDADLFLICEEMDVWPRFEDLDEALRTAPAARHLL